MACVKQIEKNGSFHDIPLGDFLAADMNDPRCWFWIDMDGMPDAGQQQVFQKLGVHPLAIQDICRDRHPPKYESFGDNHLIIMKGLARDNELEGMQYDPIQLGMLFSDKFVITRHNGSPSVEQIASQETFSTSVNLVFSILRLLHSRYLTWLLEHEENFEEAESGLFEGSAEATLDMLVSSKKELRKLHRAFNYMAKMFQQLDEDGLNEQYQAHCPDLNDLYEKFERLSSMSLMYYDQTGDLIEGFISLSSHRLNRTMQILTVITAIFVPLSFLAGIYGMNFDVMPELKFKHGYFFLLGFMAALAISLIALFKKFKWF